MKTFFIGLLAFIGSLFGVQNHTSSQKVVAHISPTPTYAITITPMPSNKPISNLLKTGVKTEPTPMYVYTSPTATPIIPTATPQPQVNTNTTNSNSQSQNTIFVPVIVKTNTPTPVPVDCSSVSSTVAAIKSEGQPAINTATAGEISLLESRGIDPSSPQGQQQMQAVLFPYQNQTNTAIAQYCYSVASTGCSCP